MTISVFGMIGPVYAADAETESGVDSAISSVAQTDATGPIDEAQRFAVTGSGELTYANDVAEVSVDAAAGADITLDSWTYEPLTIDAGLVGEVGFTDAGTAVWTSDAGYSTAPLPHEDGSVQIITVIDRADAPERYNYQLSLEGGLTLSPIEDGVILILDADGNYAGGVAAPWAYDANGVAVPTHFEIDGTQLTQVVDHAAGDFAYPITADPYLGQQLFQWITVDRAYNDIRVNLQPTDFGRGVPPWVMTGAGWSEATSWGGSVPGYLNSKATMRQQFDCHAFGNAFAGVWNLERFRPNRTVVWSNGVGTHHCNWTTATGL